MTRVGAPADYDRSAPRLALCLLVAGALHAVLLLVVNFPAPSPAPVRPIEVRLVYAEPAPSTSQKKQAVTSPQVQKPQDLASPVETSAAVPVAAVAVAAVAEPAPEVATPAPARQPDPLAGRSALELARAVAAFGGRERRPPAAGLRVQRLGHATPEDSALAFYLASWQRKVERFGRLNYPQRARARNLTGSLRLLVVIAADGALTDVRVTQSSGHLVLDEAAVRIVRLAAPYAPFSPQMLKSADVLEIERTWRFQNDGYTSS